MSFELKQHLVQTLGGAGNSVLGLVTSNVELLYSDMSDLQRDLLDESEVCWQRPVARNECNRHCVAGQSPVKLEVKLGYRFFSLSLRMS